MSEQLFDGIKRCEEWQVRAARKIMVRNQKSFSTSRDIRRRYCFTRYLSPQSCSPCQLGLGLDLLSALSSGQSDSAFSSALVVSAHFVEKKLAEEVGAEEESGGGAISRRDVLHAAKAAMDIKAAAEARRTDGELDF